VSCPDRRRRPFGTGPADYTENIYKICCRSIDRYRISPGDSGSWCCGADTAGSPARRCSPGCSSSSRCRMGSQTVPGPFAAASPASGTWRVGSETRPAEERNKFGRGLLFKFLKADGRRQRA